MVQGRGARVTEVAHVAIRLSPAKVILNSIEVWEHHQLSINGRQVLQLRSWKETAPVKGIACSEMSHHSARNCAAVGKIPITTAL